MKTLKKLIALCFVLVSIVSSIEASEKVYIDSKELNIHQNLFRMHVGNNVWLETNTVHRDDTGLYTFESDINTFLNNQTRKAEYIKKWKCPYCYTYWPMGSACQNKDCPSKYK